MLWTPGRATPGHGRTRLNKTGELPVRKYLLTAAAAAAIATPAAARDHSGYVGLDAGVMWAKSSLHLDATDSFYCDYLSYYFDTCSTGFGTKHKIGFDGDVVGGYDFGMFRLEGELAYKTAKQKRRTFSDLGTVALSGKTTSWSAMVNGLVDFGDDNGVNFSLGGGVGWAHTKYNFNFNGDFTAGEGDYYFNNFGTSLSKSKFAWQLLAEARYAVSPQFDVGLKYRYFNAGKLNRSFDDGDGGIVRANTKFHSHSVMLSLIYNFAPPPPPPPAPPPPPPPAPATQTCPDGSVIDATATCPAPPPPPPPPPPPTERGERGN